MREIKLVNTTIKEENIEVNYREQYIGLLRKPVNGMTIAQMEVAVRVAAKLKTLPATANRIQLEEDEWQLLNNLIIENKWALVYPEILAMIKNITEAQVSPNVITA